jgi:pimeloyl-ACP methyl ester carboxylesterase
MYCLDIDSPLQKSRIIGFIGLYGLYNASDPTVWDNALIRRLSKHVALQTHNNPQHNTKWLESSPAWWSSSLCSITNNLETRSTDWASPIKQKLAHQRYLSTFLVHGTHDLITPFSQSRDFHQRLKRDNLHHFNALFPIEHGHHAFDFEHDDKTVLVGDALHLYLVWNNHQCTPNSETPGVQVTEEKHLHATNAGDSRD